METLTKKVVSLYERMKEDREFRKRIIQDPSVLSKIGFKAEAIPQKIDEPSEEGNSTGITQVWYPTCG